jgi:hypothetical protein
MLGWFGSAAFGGAEGRRNSEPLLNFGSGLRSRTEPCASGSFSNDQPGAARGGVVSVLAAWRYSRLGTFISAGPDVSILHVAKITRWVWPFQ